jgi:hypothetical protein
MHFASYAVSSDFSMVYQPDGAGPGSFDCGEMDDFIRERGLKTPALPGFFQMHSLN